VFKLVRLLRGEDAAFNQRIMADLSRWDWTAGLELYGIDYSWSGNVWIGQIHASPSQNVIALNLAIICPI
jgi:hypothetical protein